MPRAPREMTHNGTFHVLARGNNGQALFHDSSDFKRYLDLVLSMKSRYSFEVFHYCLMTNHIHFLMRFGDSTALTKVIQRVNLRFAKRYCGKLRYAGHVFQDRFKTLPICDDAYLLECGRYIERNPYKAGMVKDPADYEWSSFRYYALGEANELLSPNPCFERLGHAPEARRKSYAGYVRLNRPYDLMLERELTWRWAGKAFRSRRGNRTLLI